MNSYVSVFRDFFTIFPESVEKKCGYNGRWEAKNGTNMNEESFVGWANYTTCLTPEMLWLHYRIYNNNNNIEGEVIFIYKC